MVAECTTQDFDFHPLGRREVIGRLDGGAITSDADRTSSGTMRANPLRLWFSSLAYVLLQALRDVGLKGTELEKARCDTIA